MGKMAAYLGPPTSIASVMELGTSALVKKTAESEGGFGVGWYPHDAHPEPLAIASRAPLWCEDNLLQLTRRYASTCIVAATHFAREAGAPPKASAVTPFRYGPYLFHHEGELVHFHDVFERPLCARLSARAHRVMRSSSPSELVFATWVDALAEHEGSEAAAGALEVMAGVIQDLALAADAPASFGVIVSDGTRLITLRTATHASPPSMFTIVASQGAPFPETARVVASDPLFPGSWSSLDPHSLVIFTNEPEEPL